MAEQHNLNLEEVLLGRPTRLRYVVRFSICPRLHDESVAEHSFYVAYIAMMIAVDLHIKGVFINVGEVLSKALLHDMDEAYSGDSIRMFKHASPSLKLAMDQTASKFMEQHSIQLDDGMWSYLNWKQAKSDSLEGRIVSLCDFLSVLSYVVQEINGGNHVMYEHLDDLQKFHKTFADEKYLPLKSYIDQAGKILRITSLKRTGAIG